MPTLDTPSLFFLRQRIKDLCRGSMFCGVFFKEGWEKLVLSVLLILFFVVALVNVIMSK